MALAFLRGFGEEGTLLLATSEACFPHPPWAMVTPGLLPCPSPLTGECADVALTVLGCPSEGGV